MAFVGRWPNTYSPHLFGRIRGEEMEVPQVSTSTSANLVQVLPMRLPRGYNATAAWVCRKPTLKIDLPREHSLEPTLPVAGRAKLRIWCPKRRGGSSPPSASLARERGYVKWLGVMAFPLTLPSGLE